METFEQQEKRARQRLRFSALVKAALVAGVITFVVPGGPWMSYESGFATMGRVLSDRVWLAALWHVAFALAYGWAIAALIYSMPTLMGIVLGALMGVPLYALNYMVLRNGMGFAGNEVHAGIAHLMFCLLFSAVYRAVAVPPPRQTDPDLRSLGESRRR
jgi:hypothetical protein